MRSLVSILWCFVQALHHLSSIHCGPVFRFARHYADHMVLPASPQKAIIWGYGETGQIVHILYQGTPYTIEVDQEVGGEASWSFVLPSNSAGGPYSIAASSKAGDKIFALTLKDVLFGDVWLCSGQGNMQFTVGQAFAAVEEFNVSSNYPSIRLMSVKRSQAGTPLYDLPEGGIEEAWTVPSKETLFKPIWDYFSAVCWMFGRRLYEKYKRPVGLISSNWEPTTIEAWSSPDVLKKCGILDNHGQIVRGNAIGSKGLGDASSVWNAMIHPFLRSNLYGVIWYGGENNAANPTHYDCLFPTMIADLRQKWHTSTNGMSDPQFPFGFVQLAPNGTESTVIDGFPTIRFAQTAFYGFVPNKVMPRTFMAVAMDLPDVSSPYGTIYPRAKTDVAKRLLLGALAVAYGEKVSWTGPLIRDVSLNFITGDLWQLLLNYDDASVSSGGIIIKNTFAVEPSPCNVEISPDITTYQKFSDDLPQSAQNSPDRIHSIQLESISMPFKECAVYEKDSDLPAPPWIAEPSFSPEQLQRRRRKIKNYL